jgi:hypothetical protein
MAQDQGISGMVFALAGKVQGTVTLMSIRNPLFAEVAAE